MNLKFSDYSFSSESQILKFSKSPKPWDYQIYKLLKSPKSSSKSNLQIVERLNPQNIQIFKIPKLLKSNHQHLQITESSNHQILRILKIVKLPNHRILEIFKTPNPRFLRIPKTFEILKSSKYFIKKVIKTRKWNLQILEIPNPQIQ